MPREKRTRRARSRDLGAILDQYVTACEEARAETTVGDRVHRARADAQQARQRWIESRYPSEGEAERVYARRATYRAYEARHAMARLAERMDRDERRRRGLRRALHLMRRRKKRIESAVRRLTRRQEPVPRNLSVAYERAMHGELTIRRKIADRLLGSGLEWRHVDQERARLRWLAHREWCACLRCDCNECNPVQRFGPARGLGRMMRCNSCACRVCFPNRRDCGECGCQDCYGGTNPRRSCESHACEYCYPNGFNCGNRECEYCNPSIPPQMQNHSYKPRPLFHILSGLGEAVVRVPRENERYYGVELETELGGRDRARLTQDGVAAWLAANEGMRYYAKHDGSLVNGVEIVSHPATFAAWCARGPELKFAETLRSLGATSYLNHRCGFHVHVSRSALPQDALAKLLIFVSNHAAAVARWSRRRSAELAQWATIERGNGKLFIRKAGGETNLDNPRGRYVAINLCNRTTVEFRLFRGTLISASILRNVGLVEALVSFARVTNSHRLGMAHFLAHLETESKAKDRTKAERAVLASTLAWARPLAVDTAKEECEALLPVES